ncbi:MAG: ATP-binding protein [Saprospiraceae bacterium]
MIQRSLTETIETALAERRKIIVLYGPRQVGKTTLVQEILRENPYKRLIINADLVKYRETLSSQDLSKMMELIGDNELIFIDEAQNIPNIGINLKILHDSLPNLQIIVTGSSSFELANQVQEPLTGRTMTFRLYPISIGELRNNLTPFDIKDQLESYLRYGMYPEVLQLPTPEAKMAHLQELASAYLYKDVLQLSGIKHADKIHKLLKLLALQVGSLVSLHELGKSLGMSHETVGHYIDLLEKGFILFRLSGYSRNPRKEITKMSKIYFYDTGIRNVLTDNFNNLDYRTDTGALWENFLIAERRKKIEYQRLYGSTYFWRTYAGAELDYIEERNGQLEGYEFKWKAKKRKAPSSWSGDYPDATYSCIDRDNFLAFVV